MKIVNVNVVEKKINNIVGLRGDKRKTALSSASMNLYNYLKTLNYSHINREFLNSFFSDDVTAKTRQRVLTAIINELKKQGRVREEYVVKTITFFRNCPLYSQDYGSYSVMMEKNKYRPEHLKGVYSMSRLSIRKATQPYKTRILVVL